MTTTALSFIIATYNRADGIINTLLTIAGQTLDPALFEVVVADNNSTDGTAARIRDFAAAHPAMNIVYCHEPNQGLSWARNCAIKHSKGQVLVIVDDDENIDPGLAGAYLEFFRGYPTAAAAGGKVVPVYGVPRPEWFSPWVEELISGAFDLGEGIKPFPPHRYPRGGNFAIRRTMINRYGDFNTELGRKGNAVMGGEEKELLGRLEKAGEEIFYLPAASIEHIIPDAKVTKEYFDKITRMVGVSEKTRTLGKSKGKYALRLAQEAFKWGATLLLAARYLATPQKAVYLVRMRAGITRGLLS